MKQLRFRYIYFSFIAILLFTQTSCNKDFGISLGNVNEDLGVTLTDSLTVKTGTVQLEYLPTSNTGSILVGKVDNGEIGATSVSSYFRVALDGSNIVIPDDAVFDSVNLVLTPNSNKYYLGDTTAQQTIHVHRVTESIELKTIPSLGGSSAVPVYVTAPAIFSDDEFAYEPDALGSLTFHPRINSIDTLNIRLDDAFGEDVFEQFVQGNATVNNNDNLQQYLKGLVLTPDANNSALVGLNDTVYVDLNYSYMGTDGLSKKGKVSLTTGTRGYQFNSFSYDRSNTPFAALTASNRELSSEETDGDIFLQAGTGVVAKLEFPSLTQFLNEPNMAVNKIELVIEANGTEYGQYPNPSSLMLLIANKHTGVPLSFVTNPFSTAIQNAQLSPGNPFGRKPTYTFNLIDYIKTVGNVANAETCLYLAVSSPQLFGRANYATIAKEDNKPKVKLNIVYTKFK